MSLDVLKQFEAENLLEGTHILSQITKLQESLRYTSDGQEISFDDFWKKLSGNVLNLPKITLKNRVAPGTEDEYLIELAGMLESVYDRAEQVLEDVLYFEGKLRGAVTECQNLKASFTAWYILALEAKLTELNMRLPGKNQTALSESEFSRLADAVEMDLEALLRVVEAQEQRIKNYRKLALNKYNLGKDQANAAWTSGLPPRENGYGGNPEALLKESDPAEEEEEEADIPQFVSRQTMISKSPVFTAPMIQNAVPVQQDPIKGVFRKEIVALTQPIAVVDNNKLQELIEAAKKIKMTDAEKEEQRRSFAAANVAIDTGKTVEEVRVLIDKVADEKSEEPVVVPKKKPIITVLRKSKPESPATSSLVTTSSSDSVLQALPSPVPSKPRKRLEFTDEDEQVL